MFGSWRLVWLAKKGGGQVIFGKHFMEHFIKHSKIGMCKEEQRIFGRPRGAGKNILACRLEILHPRGLIIIAQPRPYNPNKLGPDI